MRMTPLASMVQKEILAIHRVSTLKTAVRRAVM